jgi:hypothetical protein
MSVASVSDCPIWMTYTIRALEISRRSQPAQRIKRACFRPINQGTKSCGIRRTLIAPPPDAQNVTHNWKIREIPSSPRFALFRMAALQEAENALEDALCF